jgi:sugar-specific transcriptional regulator TrmB
MAKRRDPPAARQSLMALGISDLEEAVYECLLSHPGASVAQIARLIAQSSQRTQRLVDAIEAKGLVTHAAERPRRYVPTAPDIAMEALLLKRQDDLQSVRTRIQELSERAAAHRQDEREQIVELSVSHEAQRQAFDHLRLGAQREIVCLTRPPMLLTPIGEPQAKCEPQVR